MDALTRNTISIFLILIGITCIIYGIFLLYRGNEKITNNESTEGNVVWGGILLGLGIFLIFATLLFSLSTEPAKFSLGGSFKTWQNISLIVILILIVAGIDVGGYFLLKNV